MVSHVFLGCVSPGTICRDLCVRGDCRAALGEAGVVHTLIGLLYSEDQGLKTQAAQTLAKLAVEPGPRKQIVWVLYSYV